VFANYDHTWNKIFLFCSVKNSLITFSFCFTYQQSNTSANANTYCTSPTEPELTNINDIRCMLELLTF